KRLPLPWNFGRNGDRLVGRYNLTDEASTLPVTGDALFSSLRPMVRTQSLAFFLNRSLSPTLNDTIRLSFGRTSLHFGENRDPFMLASSTLPGVPFLLNAPLVLNETLPGQSPALVSGSSGAGSSLLKSLGFSGIAESEQITGPLGQVIIPG